VRRAHDTRLTAQKGDFEAIATQLIAAGPITIEARAGEEGKLFGSVTAEQISAAIAQAFELTIDKKDVHLDEPIRSVGSHEVRLHLFHEVEPVVTIEVVSEA
jgi:large subunit ribosomal protein L9